MGLIRRQSLSCPVGGAAVLGVALAVAVASSGASGLQGRIAFVRYTADLGHPRIFTVPAAGGAPRMLRVPVAAAESPSWSRDGRWIAFVGGENPQGSADIAGNDAVYVSRANGRGMRRLTSGSAHDGEIAWSPDGKRLVFVRSARGSLSSLWTVRAEGRGARRLTFGNLDREPSWSPDGRTIAFLRIDVKSYRSGVWLVRPDGSSLRQILAGLRGVTEPVWSPDGRRLLIEDGRTLYSVRPDGSDRRTIARLSADAQGSLEDPQAAWSPDGRWVVFCQLRSGAVGGSDIWIVRSDGSGLRRLTRSPEKDTDPSWGT